jgi:hypothetical protein
MSVRSDIPTSVFTFFVGGSSIVSSGHRSFMCLCKSCKVANTWPQSSQLGISSSLSDMISFCLVVCINFRSFGFVIITVRSEGCDIGLALITFCILIWGDKISVFSLCDSAVPGLKSTVGTRLLRMSSSSCRGFSDRFVWPMVRSDVCLRAN